MLTQVVTATTTATAKQIVASLNNSNTVYTVPSGKTFTGYIVGYSTSAGATINGVTVYATAGTGGFATGVVPLTLVAGTVVVGISQNAALIGIEQ